MDTKEAYLKEQTPFVGLLYQLLHALTSDASHVKQPASDGHLSEPYNRTPSAEVGLAKPLTSDWQLPHSCLQNFFQFFV